MNLVDPLADHVRLEFTVKIECLFVDEPKRSWEDEWELGFRDDARHVIAEQIADAIVTEVDEVLNLGVSWPGRDGSRNAYIVAEASSLDIDPIQPLDDE